MLPTVNRSLSQFFSKLMPTSLLTMPVICHQPKRQASSKHWLLKFRPLRKRKFLPVDLPNVQKLKEEQGMSPDEMRIWLKKQGKLPPRGFEERPINISSTGDIFDAYIPPEGDGKSSMLSKESPKQAYSALDSKRKSLLALRQMKKLDEKIDQPEFARQSQDLYIESQMLLCNLKDNEDRLHDIVTENAFPLMVHGLEKKTFRWRFIETIEPPRVTHIRTRDLMSKDNIYAQVTVRMHTKQTLAIYDRFGRLMFGNENLIRDVLEYVVFEKHISDIYGQWRIHGKIIPSWMPKSDPVVRTHVDPNWRHSTVLPSTENSTDITTISTSEAPS